MAMTYSKFDNVRIDSAIIDSNYLDYDKNPDPPKYSMYKRGKHVLTHIIHYLTYIESAYKKYIHEFENDDIAQLYYECVL